MSLFDSTPLFSIAPSSTPQLARSLIVCPPGCRPYLPASTARLFTYISFRPQHATQVPPVPWIPEPHVCECCVTRLFPPPSLCLHQPVPRSLSAPRGSTFQESLPTSDCLPPSLSRPLPLLPSLTGTPVPAGPEVFFLVLHVPL